jgi:hypothetical protein
MDLQTQSVSSSVIAYLDENLPGWRGCPQVSGKDEMLRAIEVVERSRERVSRGGLMLPRLKKRKGVIDAEEREDALYLETIRRRVGDVTDKAREEVDLTVEESSVEESSAEASDESLVEAKGPDEIDLTGEDAFLE